MSRSYKKPFVYIVGRKRRSLRFVKRLANKRYRQSSKFSSEIFSHRKMNDLAWNEDLIKKHSSRVEDTRK